MVTNAIQRRNTDEQSDSTGYTGRAHCLVCSEDKRLSDYSLHVRRWDGAYVAKANICVECVEDERAAWRYNRETNR